MHIVVAEVVKGVQLVEDLGRDAAIVLGEPLDQIAEALPLDLLHCAEWMGYPVQPIIADHLGDGSRNHDRGFVESIAVEHLCLDVGSGRWAIIESENDCSVYPSQDLVVDLRAILVCELLSNLAEDPVVRRPIAPL